MPALSEKAMLVSVNISEWTARKRDSEVTRKTIAAHHASDDSGWFNKSLVARTALAEIIKTRGKIWTYHRANTLPWVFRGSDILPAKNYFQYMQEMNTLKRDFEVAADRFAASYATLKLDAQRDMGTMFDESDYPPAYLIRRRFKCDVSVLPLPESGDFRVDMSAAEVDRLRGEISAQMTAAIGDAMRGAWRRIAETVQHVSDKLRDYKPAADGNKASGVFRDTLVENVRELVDILPRLNLTDDQSLADMIERMREGLCSTEPEVLRTDDKARADTLAAADAMLAELGEYLGDPDDPEAGL